MMIRLRVMRELVLITAVVGCSLSPLPPPTISTYGSEIGANAKARHGRHPGIDFAGTIGDPVIAAADGVVIDVSDSPASSGKCVALRHGIRGRAWFTLYCHLDRILTNRGNLVTRGTKIGELGASGAGAGGIAHLHFQLCTRACTTASFDGNLEHTVDPATYTIGCFDPERTYNPDALQLTYPVEC